MKSWQAAPAPDAPFVAELAARAGISPELAMLVARRTVSVEAALAWLNPIGQPLSDPFDWPGMREVVARIRKALERGEAITVFGDYDTDGITATAVMEAGLRALGAACVKPFFPDRETEGYGLSTDALARCLGPCGHTPDLLITVDCGITSYEEVAELNRRGIEVVITDHHTLPEVLPEAVATVNPRLLPEGHPARDLCGCATAFTVLRALEADGLPLHAEDFLDLVAVATIADVMMLTGDNRTLVARGLKVLENYTQGNKGLQALATVQKLLPGELTAERVAFGLVPCINAAGRLGHQELKVAYGLIGRENARLASTLQQANERRREIERALFETILATNPSPSPHGNAVIVGGEGFHAGVLGIVAARLMERFSLPTAILCRTAEGGGHGSMRSCGTWNAVHALDSVRDLLSHYGGHAQAAGFSLRPGCYDAFCERLPKAFTEQPPPTPETYDLDLTFRPIALELCMELDRLEPYGNGNPKPIFTKSFTIRSLRPCGDTKVHLLLDLAPDDEGGVPLRAIWFNGVRHATGWQENDRIRAYFNLGVDTFRAPCPKITILDAHLQ